MEKLSFIQKWKHYLRMGFLAILFITIGGFFAQILYYILCIPFFGLFDGGKNEWLAIVLSIIYLVLIGIPVIGYVFAWTYPAEQQLKFEMKLLNKQPDGEGNDARETVTDSPQP